MKQNLPGVFLSCTESLPSNSTATATLAETINNPNEIKAQMQKVEIVPDLSFLNNDSI